MRHWLIAIREEKELTQRHVAEQVGISPPSLCAIERGTSNPTVKTAQALGYVLGFDWTRFFEDGE